MTKKKKPHELLPRGRSAGRSVEPVRVTPEEADGILEELIGGKSLRDVFKDRGYPLCQLVKMFEQTPGFLDAYSRAQEIKAELVAEDVIHIADTDFDPQRARNRIDARKWYASKIKPGKYGEKLDVNVNHTVDIGQALIEAKARSEKKVDDDIFD